MLKKILTSIIIFTLFTSPLLQGQNLLNSSSWTVGNGSIPGFTRIGAHDNNIRLLGEDHLGEEKVLWVGKANLSQTTDGGFFTSNISIDSNKTYRISFWIKRTGSNNGTNYFGCTTDSPENLIVNVNGDAQPGHYFWAGDSPLIDRWYLFTAFVNNQGYSGPTKGKIYDGITSEIVSGMHQDLKFNGTVSTLGMRIFLVNSEEADVSQVVYEPRIDLVDGNEPSIDELMRINPNSKLLISYDLAGNQTQRFYCSMVSGDCNIPTPPSNISQAKTEELVDDDFVKDISIDSSFKLFPNPTDGLVTVTTSSGDVGFVHGAIYSIDGALLIDKTANEQNRMSFDLSNYSSGVYIIHLHYDNNETITKKIIKN